MLQGVVRFISHCLGVVWNAQYPGRNDHWIIGFFQFVWASKWLFQVGHMAPQAKSIVTTRYKLSLEPKHSQVPSPKVSQDNLNNHGPRDSKEASIPSAPQLLYTRHVVQLVTLSIGCPQIPAVGRFKNKWSFLKAWCGSGHGLHASREKRQSLGSI